MFYNSTRLFLPAIILLFAGIVWLIRPDLGWYQKVGRWVDGDAEPSESYIRRARIAGIIAIILSVVMFCLSFR